MATSGIYGRVLTVALLMFVVLCPLSAENRREAAQQERYVSVDDLASRMGLVVQRSSSGDKLKYTLTSRWSTIVLTEGKRAMTLNGVAVHLSRPVTVRGGNLFISASDEAKNVLPLLLPQNSGTPPNVRRIVLDPGHGGRDNGAENRALGIREKNLALDLARRLETVLEARGYIVTLTRDKDVYPELEERPAFAARNNADLFISLHFNASTDKSVTGAETFILTPAGQPSSNGTSSSESGAHPGNTFDAWNVLLGYYTQRELVNTFGAGDRGLKRARFAVLRTLHCPGMLVEGGFLSNNGECSRLAEGAHRQKLAEAIANAVDAYARTLERVRSQNK
jgi:N-acetylmuramoyl-L-alanine amidase